jgi:hypothetical protein
VTSRRYPFALAILTLGVLLLATAVLAGCGLRTVSVKTGEIVVCTSGEQVSSSVRTIRVPAKEAGKYSVKTTRITCEKHAQLEKLYSEAQTALESQDFKTAQTKLTELVKIDATYKLASKQLTAIKQGEKPTPDGAAGTPASAPATGTAPPGNQGKPGETAKPEGPVASLLVYTPDSLAGFKAQPVGSDAFSVSRQYLPVAAGDIASLVVYAEQRNSDQDAKSWVSANVKQRYTQSARNVRIGKRDAYLATDGRRFAIIAWTEGPITVAVEADAGASPSSAFRQLQAVANSIAN